GVRPGHDPPDPHRPAGERILRVHHLVGPGGDLALPGQDGEHDPAGGHVLLPPAPAGSGDRGAVGLPHRDRAGGGCRPARQHEAAGPGPAPRQPRSAVARRRDPATQLRVEAVTLAMRTRLSSVVVGSIPVLPFFGPGPTIDVRPKAAPLESNPQRYTQFLATIVADEVSVEIVPL